MKDTFLERDLVEDELLSVVSRANADHRSSRAALRPYLDIARLTLGDSGSSGEPARWALVDGLSCAMTVGVALPLATLEKSGEAQDVQRVMERVVERYLQAPGVSRPGLVRRPALQILVMPQEGKRGDRWEQVVHTVEIAARGLEARVGLQLPDFRVVLGEGYVEEGEIGATADLGPRPSVFHLRFLSRLAGARPSLAPLVQALEAELDRVANRFEQMLTTVQETLAEERPSGFQVGSCLADLRAAPDLFNLLSGITAPPTDVQGDAEKPRESRRLPVPLDLMLNVRHWVKGEPARLALSNLTLVLGENAAGKTTVAEAMALLASGLPRVRVRPPVGSDEIGGDVTLTLLHPAGEPRWSTAELLPLFADDADLSGGRVGELALPTFWPMDGALPLIQGVRRLSEASLRYRGELLRLEEHLERLSLAPSPAAWGDLNLRDGLRWRLDDWINQWRANMRHWQDPTHTDYRDPKELDADPAVKTWRALDADLTARTRGHTRRSPRLHVNAALMTPLASDLLAFVLPDYAGAAPRARWTDIHDMLARIGAEALAYQAAARLLEERRRLLVIAETNWDTSLDDAVKTWLERSGAKSRLSDVEDRLDHLLDHRVAPEDVRPNTATLVRVSLAKRIARSLVFGAYTMPMITLDEPTLGQHETASARTLARYTRLARTVESAAWQGPWSQTLTVETLQLSGLRAGDREDLSAPWSPETVERWTWVSLDVCRSHRAPPLLVLSYGRAALNALATVEGESLTYTISNDLRKLVPDGWRAPLAAALRAVEETWAPPGAGAVPPRLPAAMAQSLLRARTWTEAPLAGLTLVLEAADAWWKTAQGAAQKLGIRSLLSEEMPPLNKEAPKEILDAQLEAYRDLAKRVVAWMALVELLPAALHDGPLHLRVTGMSTLLLRYQGGDAQQEGPARLRRVSPAMLMLPKLMDDPAAPVLALPEASAPQELTAPPPASLETTPLNTFIFDQPELSPADLRGALAAWRAQARADEPLRLGLFTSGQYPWNGGDVHLLLDADLRAPGQIAQRFGPELDTLYRAVVDLSPPAVIFHVRASAAIAARAGWVFRQVTRSPVQVMAGARNTPETPWSLDEPAPIGEDPKLSIEGADPDEARELHAVILPTPNGRKEMYDAWMKEDEARELVGRVRTVAVLDRVDLNNPGMVARWADLIVSAIQSERSRKKGRRVRLFLSGPTALAFAIGRRLNALGEVVLMDTTADREGYEERFTLKT